MTPERYARVKEVFQAVNERPLLERIHFLNEVCAGDADLQREVESLLVFDSDQTLIVNPAAAKRLDSTMTSLGLNATVFTNSKQLARTTTRAIRRVAIDLGPKGQIAIGIVLTTAVLTLLGMWMHAGIKYSLTESRRTEVQTHLDADVAAIENWFDLETERFRIVQINPLLQKTVTELNDGAFDEKGKLTEHEQSDLQARFSGLQQHFQTTLGRASVFTLWSPQLRVIVDSANPLLRGKHASEAGGAILAKALRGETLIRMPHVKDATLTGDSDVLPHPVMTLVLPMSDLAAQQIVGVFVVRGLDLEQRFSQILMRVRPGLTGETYAFDKHGIMLSESRFNDDLRRLGLIPNSPKSHSSLLLEIRDPGGDMTEGFQPNRPRAAQPLTLMAQFATAEQDGTNLEGYRDYRGVPVIGAWKWLPNRGFGITTEIDCSEAFAALRYVDYTFTVMFAVLMASLGLISWWVLSLLKRNREIGVHLQVGQYTLVRAIGEGGMGSVYLARHALLKRPTAIKLLKPEHSSQQGLAWFDREVQLASQLSHPNTIEIFDYGHTPEGIFYYAMEYLPGLTLAQLVSIGGSLPSSRVIHVLRQVCGSLREAHALNLVHRDIKPQNIMVCEQAGEYDVVKVLDFGLVKNVSEDDSKSITKTGTLAGTPLYIAPERLRNPEISDPRVDIYAFGAVAFFLLTGRDVFQGKSEADLFYQVMNSPVPRPSCLISTPIPDELDELVVDCLAKDPADRPQSMCEILAILSAAQCMNRWGQTDAFRWWQTHSGRLPDETRVV